MVIDLTLRTGLVIAVIIATKKYGIWESAEETQKLYDTAVMRIQPFASQTIDYLNIYVPALPPEREKTFLGVYYYNQAVKTVTEFITIFPTYSLYIVEKVPTIIDKYRQELRDKYEHKMQSELKKEKESIIIDDKQLVQPLVPHPDEKCKCNKNLKEAAPGLMPGDTPPPPCKDHCSKSSTVKPPCCRSEKVCKCPKCANKEGCPIKPKCPNKDCMECMRREASKLSSVEPKPIH